jgi:hypothetical protein
VHFWRHVGSLLTVITKVLLFSWQADGGGVTLAPLAELALLIGVLCFTFNMCARYSVERAEGAAALP